LVLEKCFDVYGCSCRVMTDTDSMPVPDGARWYTSHGVVYTRVGSSNTIPLRLLFLGKEMPAPSHGEKFLVILTGRLRGRIERVLAAMQGEWRYRCHFYFDTAGSVRHRTTENGQNEIMWGDDGMVPLHQLDMVPACNRRIYENDINQRSGILEHRRHSYGCHKWMCKHRTHEWDIVLSERLYVLRIRADNVRLCYNGQISSRICTGISPESAYLSRSRYSGQYHVDITNNDDDT